MPAIRSNQKTKKLAIALRHTPTPAEVKLWYYLWSNQLNVHSFRRQHAIGLYITDLCCIKQKLIIELDGGQHVEQVEYDRHRTEYLISRGYRVVRFWNDDVMKNINSVLESINEALK